MAMHSKKEDDLVADKVQVALEESFLEMIVKSTKTTTLAATPATSATSSPSLPPSSPPLNGARFILERLDGNVDNNYNDNGLDAATGTAITFSTQSTTISNPISPIEAKPIMNSAWRVPASKKSLRTCNPIRAIVDPIMASAASATKEVSGNECREVKEQISLALGDPTAYGNIPPCPAIVSAITQCLQSSQSYGYINACGTTKARMAIAKHHSSHIHWRKMEGTILNQSNDVDAHCVAIDGQENNHMISVSPDDVIVANGVSGALELALTALLDEDTVLLVPRPGFPLYQVIAESHGASVVQYDLLPDKGWECDLDHMESILLSHGSGSGSSGGVRSELATSNNNVVRGILINNPSNPTGAVYSENHLLEIIKLAEKYRVPIIADEIYGDLTFGCNGKSFHPMAKAAAVMGYSVPIITASGLGKQYIVPGWRLGWIVFQDSHCGAIQEVKKGAHRLAQVILGSSHLAQMAIPAVLDPPSASDRRSIESWKRNFHSIIEKQANLLCGLLNECHGLEVIFPEGAMYAMVRIDVEKFDDQIFDDMSFMKVLLEEENVVVLPGCAFGLAGEKSESSVRHAFRVVFCAPESILRDAANRISSFCLRHSRHTSIE